MYSPKKERSALLTFLQPSMPMLDAALAYAVNRFFIIPLGERSKRPIFGDWPNRATCDVDKIRGWWSQNPNYNIGIVVKLSCLLVIDIDPRHGGNETYDALAEEFGKLPPTYTVATGGGGRHFIYRLPADYDEDIPQFPLGKDSGFEVRNFGQVVAPPSRTSEYYTVVDGSPNELTLAPLHWLDEVSGGIAKQRTHYEFDEVIPDGARNETCAQLAGLLRRHGASEEQIVAMIDGLGQGGFIENYSTFEPEVRTIARSIARHPPSGVHFQDLKFNIVSRRSPKPELSPLALQGVLGDWVQTVLPHTEAHPAALLSQALVACGNAMGPKPAFMAERVRHRAALYCVIVGQSSRGAKGASWSRVRELLEFPLHDWSYNAQGLSSGEGLIERLADDLELEESATINGEKVQFTVKGTNDKRFLVVEQEFARPLHAAQRVGNTLNDVLRELFDEGSTGKLTVQAKTVTDALFSLIGHTTQYELKHLLNPIDMMNGFGNRIMWVYSEHSKLLPNSGPLPKATMQPFHDYLAEVFEFAQTEVSAPFKWTRQSRALWDRSYYDLMKNKYTDIVDTITKRGRTIIRRMALIYAVLDFSKTIRTEHLEAAMAMWQYCEDTVMFLFSNHLGEPMADRVLNVLHEHPAGLQMREINHALHGNYTSVQIKRGLEVLAERNLVIELKARRGRQVSTIFIPNPRD